MKVSKFLLIITGLYSSSIFNPFVAGGQAKSLYSWERQQAAVSATGDLQWAPDPFQFTPGSSVRYIDFETGDDNNNGTSTSSPWKHHPWDAAATGNARNGSGIQTYVFKRGVIYRGYLNADDNGDPGNPVKLTSDPSWGTGEACIFGSVAVTGGWTQGNATTAPNIPNPDKVWYKDIGILENPTKVVAELTGSGYNRIYLARSPNFQHTPDEPMKTWWTFTNKAILGGQLQLTDNLNLTQSQVDFYKGGDVWAVEDVVVMATMWKKNILNYNPSTKTISVSLDDSKANFGGKDCKYYVENTPFMLDSPGEYYYNKTTGRIFVRLQGEKDPNTTTIEVASKSKLINFLYRSNIEISGLTFGFTTFDNVRYGTNDAVPTLMFDGCENITIKNCKFQLLNGAIMANGNSSSTGFIISDNEMYNMDDFAILFNGPDKISVLRNKVIESGTRHLGRWYSSIPAIAGGPVTVGEIAGNIIEHAWGSGINFTWGKNHMSGTTVPLVRGFVHHNRVTHSLQGVNDYGGIEAWQGGPVFTYNNISEDAQGWHYNWWVGHIMSLGYPFYFDGSFKQYVFNNIMRGTGWNRSSASYMQVLGFYNMYAHNVAYNGGAFSGSGDGNLAIDGQNCFLANVSDSTEKQFDHTTIAAGVPFDSYGKNFFSGNAFKGNFLTNGSNPRFEFTFNEFYDKLNTFKPDLGQLGAVTSKRVFEKPWDNDFRPTASSELIDQGVKFFAPFPLSSVVGEWHFLKHVSDTTLIKGENFYLTNEFMNRELFKNVPKNHMKAYSMASPAFINGELEDWTDGAMQFNGTTTFCSLTNSETAATLCNNVDMTNNSFILEIYFRTTSSHTGGVLISKFDAAGYGYQIDISSSGNPRFSIINNGTSAYSKLGSEVINDGSWHHLLVEVNRAASVVNIFTDGITTSGSETGIMPGSSTSLTNGANFFTGKNRNGNFFAGAIDFLRVSRGTLADAQTTIDELYKWEFDGPFLYDFAGNPPQGKRDAGAIERGVKLCDMTLTSKELVFDEAGGNQSVMVSAQLGFEITKTDGTFFTHTLSGNEISVTVPASTQTRKGEIYIYGCNETIRLKIIQGNPVGIEDLLNEQIRIKPNPVTGYGFTIVVPDWLPSGRGSIYSLTGELISDFSIYSGENRVERSFSPGMYLLVLKGNNYRATRKIVVSQ